MDLDLLRGISRSSSYRVTSVSFEDYNMSLTFTLSIVFSWKSLHAAFCSVYLFFTFLFTLYLNVCLHYRLFPKTHTHTNTRTHTHTHTHTTHTNTHTHNTHGYTDAHTDYLCGLEIMKDKFTQLHQQKVFGKKISMTMLLIFMIFIIFGDTIVSTQLILYSSYSIINYHFLFLIIRFSIFLFFYFFYFDICCMFIIIIIIIYYYY